MSTLDLLIIGPASRSTGGVAQFLTEQKEHLPSGIDVTVHDDGTVDGAFTEHPGVATSSSLCGIAGLATRDQPDVVHVHSSHGLSFHRAAVYVLYAARVLDAGVVLHIHGSSFDDFLETENPLTGHIQSMVFEATDAVVVLSEYWEQALESHVDAEKLSVVPNAVDIDDYDPAQLNSEQTPTVETTNNGRSRHRDRGSGVSRERHDSHAQLDGEPSSETIPTVAFVSNHVPRKGIGELVEAIDRLKQADTPPFRVRLAGDGPEADHAQSLARQYERVEYLGYISEKEKRLLLADASIYVLPSHAEGLPIALLEGMATGNAVLTTTVGSIPEVVDENNGRLVTPGDIDQITEALNWLLENPGAVGQMGEQNHRLVREEYSWDAVTDRLVSLYESVAPGTVVPETGYP